MIPKIFLTDQSLIDVWFEGDPTRVYEILTDKNSVRQTRSNTHPLYVLLVYPVLSAVTRILNSDSVDALRMIIASTAFVWIVVIFTLFRWMGCRRLDAVLLSLVAGGSAAGIFWFAVPETFSLGSLSILLALCLVTQSEHRVPWTGWFFLVNLATLSITLTNWMAGILASLVNLGMRRTIRLTAYVFVFASVLWSIQKLNFPETKFFMDFAREATFMFLPESGGPLHVVKSFFYHTLVMPAITLVPEPGRPQWPMMLTQLSPPGSGTVFGFIAVILWTALLILGTYALFSLKTLQKLRIVLGLLILGQLGMHLVYGNETFLYSLHFLVILVPLAALSFLTPLRPVALILTLLLLPCLTVNNAALFKKALDFFTQHGDERDLLKVQMTFRPDDPWPRGEGHVVLGYPGTEISAKAYHEPGGNFSPFVGSFGVSVWVLNRQGKLLTTSERIPVKDIQQRFVYLGLPVPDIVTETKYYKAVWSAVQPGTWKLILQKTTDDVDLVLAVRSVGPAGGPIESMDWNNNQLSINNRWILTAEPSNKPYLTDETQKGWMTARPESIHWSHKNGWGCAKFLPSDSALSLTIADPKFINMSDLTYVPAAGIQLSLPDEKFVASLNAQVAHIVMTTVGLETRPGDPVELPFAWQRDAAYMVTALAAAGQLEMAKQLSVSIAENDFFGGYGTEADAPGLAIWALTEVSDRLKDPQYDQWIWPHVRRKAEIIEKMMTATKALHISSQGPVLPSRQDDRHSWLSRLASPAEGGFIAGKVNLHYPDFYVNAISYRGLADASTLAARMQNSELSSQWQSKAYVLQTLWGQKFSQSAENPSNPFTYSSSLWPSLIAEPYKDVFLKNLEKRWQSTHNERDDFRHNLDKPSFAVADAHQWLLLGKSERSWRTLRWFWNHQASEGLYSWQENVGRDDFVDGWKKIRGWMNTRRVTPHSWTAAEMLLLQLDMLAYLDEQSPESVIVIGAGIPVEWLVHPMEVKGRSLPQRTVDWSWDGKQMHVTVRGQAAKVRLGESFPPDTLITISNGNSL